MSPIPAQVTFRGIDHSDWVDADIRERISWLGQFYDRLLGCRVLVERSHRHRRDGRHFHVRIELSVPGGSPIVVSHEPSLHGGRAGSDVEAHRKRDEIDGVRRYPTVAVREAFDVARRRLQDFAREQRGDVTPFGSRAATMRRAG